MNFDDRLKDEIQAANDIVDVISQYFPLKKSGRNFKAPCPFHQEKTPSFMVNAEKQIFHCFGCGVGGDVFSFLMRYENTNFPEALRQLAERAHIQLPEKTSFNDKQKSENSALFEIYETAAEYYHQQLMRAESAGPAREYLKKRKLNSEIAKEFSLGWANNEWQKLYEHLSNKGYNDKLLIKSSLIHQSAKGRCYDVFRGRILFPIKNLQGKIVGFGGRLIEDGDGPKYLNSPENPVFRKRKELFGLYTAKKFINRDKPQLIVVEGYMDFLRLYSSGFKAAVATLGTALTNEHVQVMKRFADESIVIFDGDQAGQAAALRGLEVFLEEGMNVKLIEMPLGCDPDDYLQEKGSKAFQELIDEAKDFFDYKLNISLKKHNAKDPLGLMKITNDFLETLAKVKNPILLNHYLKLLAHALNIDENSLRNELMKLTKKMSQHEKRYSNKPGSQSDDAAILNQKLPEVLTKEEFIVLAFMIENPLFASRGSQELNGESFQSEAAYGLFQRILSIDPQCDQKQRMRVLNQLDSEALKKGIIEIFALEWDDEAKSKAFQDCLIQLKKHVVDRKLKALRYSIAKAERTGNTAEVESFVKEYQALLAQAKS